MPPRSPLLDPTSNTMPLGTPPALSPIVSRGDVTTCNSSLRSGMLPVGPRPGQRCHVVATSQNGTVSSADVSSNPLLPKRLAAALTKVSDENRALQEGRWAKTLAIAKAGESTGADVGGFVEAHRQRLLRQKQEGRKKEMAAAALSRKVWGEYAAAREARVTEAARFVDSWLGLRSSKKKSFKRRVQEMHREERAHLNVLNGRLRQKVLDHTTALRNEEKERSVFLAACSQKNRQRLSSRHNVEELQFAAACENGKTIALVAEQHKEFMQIEADKEFLAKQERAKEVVGNLVRAKDEKRRLESSASERVALEERRYAQARVARSVRVNALLDAESLARARTIQRESATRIKLKEALRRTFSQVWAHLKIAASDQAGQSRMHEAVVQRVVQHNLAMEGQQRRMEARIRRERARASTHATKMLASMQLQQEHLSQLNSSCDTRSTWLSEVRSKRRSSSPQQASVKHPVPEDVEDTAGVNWLALLEKCSNSQCESDSD